MGFGIKPRAALRMKGEHVAYGAVHRRRYGDLGTEVDHAAGEPLQLESLALLQVVVHRRRHFRRPAVEEWYALFGVIRGQRDAMRAADGDHLTREVEQEFSRARVRADRPDRLAHGGGRAGHRHQRYVFLPDRAADIVANLGVDAPALAGLVKCLEARGTAPVVFSKHEPLQRTRLRDHTGPADVGPDIGDAAHERVVAEDRPQHIVLLHAVLKRHHAGAGLHDRQQLARGVLGVPELDAEHHDIDGADGAGIVGHVDFGQMERLRPAFDRETVLAHGGKMRPARNEMHIGAALDEPGAEIPAHTPRAHNRNSQRALQPQADAAILCPRSHLNRLGARPPCGADTLWGSCRVRKRSCGLKGKSPYWARSARRAQSTRRTVRGRRKGPSKSLTRALRPCPEFRLYPARSCSDSTRSSVRSTASPRPPTATRPTTSSGSPARTANPSVCGSRSRSRASRAINST